MPFALNNKTCKKIDRLVDRFMMVYSSPCILYLENNTVIIITKRVLINFKNAQHRKENTNAGTDIDFSAPLDMPTTLAGAVISSAST